jgi:amidohydrolase
MTATEPAIASAAAPLASPIGNALTQLRGELVDAARQVHSFAETAYEEHRSAEVLAGLLERHGFEVRRGVSGMDTAFVADIVSPAGGADSPAVAFVCEYDALRGLGHACGHNLIGTGSAGAGLALAVALRELGLPGRVRVVGAPAEEEGGGKIPLSRDGVFDDCDAALIFHPSDRTFAVMYALACTHWKWAFTGFAAHAASDPDQGRNALDAFVQAYNGIAMWRQRLKDGARVHGCIFEGGTAPNIIPERSSGEYLTRARDGLYLEVMNRDFRRIWEAAAAATGCELDLRQESGYLDLRSNPVLAARCEVHLAACGLDPQRSVPWDRVGSTDVGDMSYAVPTLHPEVAITDAGVSCHTHAFREAADSERGYDALIRGAQALALTGADVVADAAIRAEVREAFVTQPWRRKKWQGSGA